MLRKHFWGAVKRPSLWGIVAAACRSTCMPGSLPGQSNDCSCLRSATAHKSQSTCLCQFWTESINVFSAVAGCECLFWFGLSCLPICVKHICIHTKHSALIQTFPIHAMPLFIKRVYRLASAHCCQCYTRSSSAPTALPSVWDLGCLHLALALATYLRPWNTQPPF